MIIVVFFLLLFLSITFYHYRQQRELKNYWQRSAQRFQDRANDEQQRRLIYERAMALPLRDPQRGNELWARAQQGDELSRWIIVEQLAQELEERHPAEQKVHFYSPE
jgi:hypothetical protein